MTKQPHAALEDLMEYDDHGFPFHKQKKEMEWRTDFENIGKGYFIASFCGKSHYAYKNSKRDKECSLFIVKAHVFDQGYKFEIIDGWMPMPEGVNK